MLTKIACNHSNSAAIDNEGKLYVWGSGQYGLLGKNLDQDYTEPKLLKFQDRMNIGKRVKKFNSYLSKNEIIDGRFITGTELSATCVSLGQYHGALVVNSTYTKESLQLNFQAEKLFKQMRDIWITEKRQYAEYAKLSDDELINLKIQDIHKQANSVLPKHEQAPYPFLRDYKSFYNIFDGPNGQSDLFTEANKKTVNVIQQKLMNQDKLINLKELRDQIIQKRFDNGLVITWGVSEGGRLGIPEENCEQIEQEQANGVQGGVVDGWSLTKCKPCIVKFPEYCIILKVSCGHSHTLALSEDQEVYSWGINNQGCLGVGEVTQINTPIKIDKTKNGIFRDIKDISCGSSHSLALSIKNKLYSWGNGAGGRLGHGDERGESFPTEISKFREINTKPIHISAGDSHSACITTDYELMVWGSGTYGRLGLGNYLSVNEPTKVEDLNQKRIKDIALGTFHSIAILGNGSIYSWGGGQYGRLGLESSQDQNFSIPKLIVSLESQKIQQVAAGPFHSLALADDGIIYSWGNQKDGKLGYDCISNQSAPKPIEEKLFHKLVEKQTQRQQFKLFQEYDMTMKLIPRLAATKSTEITMISSGYYNTMFLTNGGEVYIAGSGRHGMLPQDYSKGGQKGEGGKKKAQNDSQPLNDNFLSEELKQRFNKFKKFMDAPHPLPVPQFCGGSKIRIRYASCGAYHAIAISLEGEAYAWGNNRQGQLGVGKLSEEYSPVPIKIKALEGKMLKMVACGESHSIFLTEGGDAYACGLNEHGKLGIGNFGASDVVQGKDKDFQETAYDATIEMQPRLLDIRSIDFIACGANHSLAITSDQVKDESLQMQIYTWGNGWNGQLGHGERQNEYNPRKVIVPYNKEAKFIMAGCGQKHSIALDKDGCIWYWGNKASVGIEDINQDEVELVPKRLPLGAHRDTTIFKFISTGDTHNMAITSDQLIFGFGQNEANKLCPSKQKLLRPQPLKLDINTKYVSCGYNHSCLISAQGWPYSWGNPANSRLGFASDTLIDPMTQETEYITEPRQITHLKDMLEKHLKEIQEEGIELEQIQIEKKDQGRKLVKAKFELQAKLKEDAGQYNEDILINQDLSIVSKFNKLTSDIHYALTKYSGQKMEIQYEAESNLISRIYNFPVKIPIFRDNINVIPHTISRNKQIIEMIFSFIQQHPCYFLNYLKKHFVYNVDFVFQLITSSMEGQWGIKRSQMIIGLFIYL